MDDQDQAQNLNTNNNSNKPPADDDIRAEAVPVPSRVRAAVDDLKARIEADDDSDRDVVAEYEARYYGGRARLEAGDVSIEDAPPRRRARPKISARSKQKLMAQPDENERKWAALAHGSTLLTALSAFTGVGPLLTIFIPLLIYFSFRKRSEYVAYHALQAFSLQVVGTIGWLALVIFGTAIAFALLIISIILIVVAVGIVLVPLVALAWLVFLVASLALPLGMVIYSVLAAIETWNGNNYRIPYISRWVESQMHTSF